MQCFMAKELKLQTRPECVLPPAQQDWFSCRTAGCLFVCLFACDESEYLSLDAGIWHVE